MYSTHNHCTAVTSTFRRPAVVVIKVAILSVVLLGFVALGVDVGLMFNARQELQRATDAAAVAAATMHSQSGRDHDPEELARQAAFECAELNPVSGDPLTLDTERDVLFGQAQRPSPDDRYIFTEGAEPINAVHVIGRRTAEAPDGPIPLYFAAIFGRAVTNATCRATALIKPRDIAIVADGSNSHNNDTELRHYRKTFINLHEVWADMFERGDWPEWDDPKDLQAAGWGWGFFKEFGRGFGYDSRLPEPSIWLDPDSYEPKYDEGLVYLPQSPSSRVKTHWDPDTNGDYKHLHDYLTGKRAYQGAFNVDDSEVQSIMGDHSTARRTARRFVHWKNRVAVATGFADWNSGLPDGKWKDWGWEEPPASESYDPGTQYRDAVLDDEEMIWSYEGAEVRAKLRETSTPEDMKELWYDYALYVSRGDTTMVLSTEAGHPDFQWRFGVKTFINLLLEDKPTHAETEEFAHAHAQPMQAVKEAVEVLAKSVLSAEHHDQLSLEFYGTTAYHLEDLSPDLEAVSDHLYSLQAGHWDGYTNLAGGLRLGRESLTTPPARPSARKVIVLLSDGHPTAFGTNIEDGVVNGEESGGSEAGVEEAKRQAVEQAEAARAEGIRIYSVSVGAAADQTFLKHLAEITGGKHYHASGSIDEYSSKLKEIFADIAELRPVALIPVG